MRTTTAFLGLFLAILCVKFNDHPATAQQPQALAVQFADVDVEKSLLTVNAKSEVPAAGVLRAVLGLPGAPKDAIGAKQAESWELRIAFKKPVAVGTAVFLSATHQSTAAILRPDYAGEPAKAAEADWLPVGTSRVLEPNTRVRAVRLSGKHTHWNMNGVRCLLFASRFDQVIDLLKQRAAVVRCGREASHRALVKLARRAIGAAHPARLAGASLSTRRARSRSSRGPRPA